MTLGKESYFTFVCLGCYTALEVKKSNTLFTGGGDVSATTEVVLGSTLNFRLAASL